MQQVNNKMLAGTFLILSILCIIVEFGLSPSLVRAAEVRNLKTGQQGARAFAVYDLNGKPGEKTADVKIFLEIGGERYEADKLALSGDYGKTVKIGKQRTVYWDVLKDMPSGFEGDLFWNVNVLSSGNPPITASPESAAATTITDPSAMIELVRVPSGCFTMGDSSGKGESDELPLHEVCLESFYIGKYEVTQGQWQTVMGTNPSFFKKCGINCPVENISWADANRFVKKLNSLSGKNYRLPSEAEWEYAARSGGKVQRFSGKDDKVAVVGWYEDNAGSATHPVGEKQPNELGVFDMSGNVAEWVQDWKGSYSPDRESSPAGPSVGKFRVIRGGSWLDDPAGLRTTYRSELSPKVRTNLNGMRLLLPSL